MLPRHRLLIQVVPRLTPSRCGVSDQAFLLARELETEFGVDTAFLVLNSNEKCDLPYPTVHCRPDELLDTCVSLSENHPAALLVHVSGYGYAADGAPALLADALAHLRSDGRFPIAAYFHELFATGMPWKSAFWYSRRQKNAICQIASESDLIVTSRDNNAKWLAQEANLRAGAQIQLLPVFSACGESAVPPGVAQREPALAVFGLAATRQRAYKTLSSLQRTLHDLGVKEIMDIGPRSWIPSELCGIPVRCKGVLAASELRSQLCRAMFGFLSYTLPYLAKSSVFASYCAQGTIPVIAKPFQEEVDGLKDGVHVLSPRTVRTARVWGWDRCSLAAWQWYQAHRLGVHAATYARWLENPRRGAGAEARVPVEATEI